MMEMNDMKRKGRISRRQTLKSIGVIGASGILGAEASEGKELVKAKAQLSGSRDVREVIFDRVFATAFVDTHEHLIEESERLAGTSNPRVRSDDWTMLFSHYLNSDMAVAGMPGGAMDKFFSPKIDALDKWRLLEPYWPAVKNTGYGQAVRITLNQLYGVDELSASTISKVQAGYEKVRRRGFYKHILQDLAKIESCQVNCLSAPFMESAMPTLLMQDLSIVGMFAGGGQDNFRKPTGVDVKSLGDWYKVIDWWFRKYGRYAVAVKSQNAYSRDIDYEPVAAERAEGLFKKRLEKRSLRGPDRKELEDHLFWYAVKKATEHKLPVKLHTGYYAGQNSMPLGRLVSNPASATELCGRARETRFVFMHICYPYYEEMIAIAKQWSNAYVDMCWSWIINPVAAKDFLKKFLVTAPSNKILTFGGDYIPVEPVLGHAVVARRGIGLALAELVEEGWIDLDDALEMVDPIMRGNATKLFNLGEKTKVLEKAKRG
ncbi:MAG: amidohydrolase family protein [Phycisphaerae bacterium]|nr:amidohydrolase family protein [Phycisphaerae bacterium]